MLYPLSRALIGTLFLARGYWPRWAAAPILSVYRLHLGGLTPPFNRLCPTMASAPKGGKVVLAKPRHDVPSPFLQTQESAACATLSRKYQAPDHGSGERRCRDNCHHDPTLHEYREMHIFPSRCGLQRECAARANGSISCEIFRPTAAGRPLSDHSGSISPCARSA